MLGIRLRARRGAMHRFTIRATSLALCAVCAPDASAQGANGVPLERESRCPTGIPPFASPFCSELVPTENFSGSTGMLELRYVRSPFGIAVTSEGRLRHALVARLSHLPSLSSLGRRAAYVAWGYDLTMARETRLAVVHDGTALLGELPYEQFRVIIAAEPDSMSKERRGRIALRATSPNALLLAHRDAMAPMMSSSGATNAGAAHGEHEGHGMDAGLTWSMPPADPRLSAFPMAHNPPSTAPFLPSVGERPIVDARPREVLTLNAGDTLRLEAGFVRRTIGGKRFVMYGYNGQYPGPLIRVRPGGEIVVRFHNAIDLPSTVHWHGIRLDNRSDGVPHITQEPVAPGDSFTYHVRFPDAGIYWYHPHVREDIQQELGLYGNILVARRAAERVPVNREEVLALDDVLLGDSGIFPLGRDTATHALMGRFGNLLLVNGEPKYTLPLKRGEVVRFYLTNVSNARTFNLRFNGARVKLVGSDLSDFEREEWVQSVVIAPAERYIIEARFDSAGTFAVTNNVQWFDHMRGTVMPVTDTLGEVTVARTPIEVDNAASFAETRAHAEVRREVAGYRRAFSRPVDHTLNLGLRLTGVAPSMIAMLVGVAIPMDWNDGMPMMNWPLTAKEVAWTLRDEKGNENMAIAWRFKRGSVARIRLVSDPTLTHAMAHPIHFHGQRFLVISRNGVPNDNLAWKDTAVLPAGETMDILLELTNPGTWMMHCHIAEHLGTGMMGSFIVER